MPKYWQHTRKGIAILRVIIWNIVVTWDRFFPTFLAMSTRQLGWQWCTGQSCTTVDAGACWWSNLHLLLAITSLSFHYYQKGLKNSSHHSQVTPGLLPLESAAMSTSSTARKLFKQIPSFSKHSSALLITCLMHLPQRYSQSPLPTYHQHFQHSSKIIVQSLTPGTGHQYSHGTDAENLAEMKWPAQNRKCSQYWN